MTGPKLKKIRRLGTPLPGLSRKATRRAGGHLPRRRRISDFRRRLEEKQKVRWHYGISERQLRNAFARAVRAPGATGENLLSLLERRLDSVVFRLGLAPTIPAARQLVAHGHIRVDGLRVDRAGYPVSPGQRVAISDRGRRIPDVAAAVARGPEVRLPAYLALEEGDRFHGRVIGTPGRRDVPFRVEESAIVEFYAR